MHNIKELRKNLNTFKKKLYDRNFNLNTDLFESLDGKNRKLISEKEKLEQEKGVLTKSKDKSNFGKSKQISNEILKLSQDQLIAQNKLNELIHILPNIAHPDVPIGKDEKSNKIINKFGKIKEFDFNPRSHIEIGSKSNDIDFETATKLSGSRFVILKNNIAKLERALINFMLDIHTNEFNYTENPSFISGSTGEVIYSYFINNPQTFPTTVGLYNDANDLLAVAKLSKPIQKDFTKEALVRVKLEF